MTERLSNVTAIVRKALSYKISQCFRVTPSKCASQRINDCDCREALLADLTEEINFIFIQQLFINLSEKVSMIVFDQRKLYFVRLKTHLDDLPLRTLMWRGSGWAEARFRSRHQRLKSEWVPCSSLWCVLEACWMRANEKDNSSAIRRRLNSLTAVVTSRMHAFAVTSVENVIRTLSRTTIESVSWSNGKAKHARLRALFWLAAGTCHSSELRNKLNGSKALWQVDPKQG